MTSTADYDAKKFPMCAPWIGDQGDSWEKQYEKDYLAASVAKTDDNGTHTWEEHLLGIDAGGTDDAGNVTAHLGNAAGNAAAQQLHADSVSEYNQRARESWVSLRKHQLRADQRVRRGHSAWRSPGYSSCTRPLSNSVCARVRSAETTFREGLAPCRRRMRVIPACPFAACRG